MKKRIGIYGWGIVGPKSPDVDRFEENLGKEPCWLEPFRGFGPSNFLVGTPDFRFEDYRPWIDQRFEPRRFSQLDAKMGGNVKYAIGAFIQALGQNPGLERLLSDLGDQAHVYVGTGLGDLPVQYEISLAYYRAQASWDEFWCGEGQNPELAAYRKAPAKERERRRLELGAPPEPAERDDVAQAEWNRFWAGRSAGLEAYLFELRAIEGADIGEDIDRDKGHAIRRKLAARQKLRTRYGAPAEPWSSVDPNLLWNIPNIPAAQISMLGRITGPAFAPVAACSTFGTALWLASNAIRLGQAKAVVVGASDPEPHGLSVGTFYGARVLSHDGKISKPLTGMRGTHVSGGACVWIVGDADYMAEWGMRPLGLEIVGVGVSSDADHIITPSEAGSRVAVRRALADAGVDPAEVATWDMHATATPGDWTELNNIRGLLPGVACLTARKGTFGHGMSVCGGWELTAQHLGMAAGRVLPVNLDRGELHPQIAGQGEFLADARGAAIEGEVAGKINMGVGGINACVISRRWPAAAGS